MGRVAHRRRSLRSIRRRLSREVDGIDGEEDGEEDGKETLVSALQQMYLRGAEDAIETALETA